MRINTSFVAAIAAAASTLLAAPAFAQTWTYALFTQNATNANAVGNSYSMTQGSVKLTVSAYSTTGAGSTIQAANLANYGAGSGFGVRNQLEIAAAGGVINNVSSPNHATDNWNATDFLALNFTNAVTAAAVNANITQLATGWHNTSASYTCGSGTIACGTDSDISLLRWTGAGGPTITGGTIASLLTAGWSLVNNYADMVDDTLRATGTTGAQTSSWWLISAYNSAWGTGTNTTGLSNGDDFVKVLSSVTATVTGTPEPGSLALAGLALLGVYGARRKAAK